MFESCLMKITFLLHSFNPVYATQCPDQSLKSVGPTTSETVKFLKQMTLKLNTFFYLPELLLTSISSPAETIARPHKPSENVVWRQKQMGGDERNEGCGIACVSIATEINSFQSIILKGRSGRESTTKRKGGLQSEEI